MFQAQTQVLIPGPVFEYNFNQFDWQAFSDKAKVQEFIDSRKQTLEYVPSRISNVLNLDKLDLVRIEQELSLYEQGFKESLSYEEIEQAEEAIRLHWESIRDIEDQIQMSSGLKVATIGSFQPLGKASAEDYLTGVWELYKGDHEVLFNMVEKTDKNLYNLLGQDDEAYAKVIMPQVEQYTAKNGRYKPILL